MIRYGRRLNTPAHLGCSMATKARRLAYGVRLAFGVKPSANIPKQIEHSRNRISKQEGIRDHEKQVKDKLRWANSVTTRKHAVYPTDRKR